MLKTALLSCNSFATGVMKVNRKVGGMAIRTNHAYTYSSSDLGKILKQQLFRSIIRGWRLIRSVTRNVEFVHLHTSFQQKSLVC